MKIRHAYALLAALTLVGATFAPASAAGIQWKWRDASGAIQYSDRPPPANTPESQILARPTAARKLPPPRPLTDAPAAASAPEAAKAASKPTAAEQELEARLRKAEEEKIAKKKADDEKAAKARADNCQQARNYQRTLQDGIRIARTNNQGEREVLDDAGRAQELQRTQEAIDANCR